MGEATAHHFAVHGARAIVIADVQDEVRELAAGSLQDTSELCFTRGG